MEGRDPIDCMAAHARKVCHAYIFAPRFVDQRKSPKQLIVVGIAQLNFLEEASIDLVDDLQMAGQ